MSDIENNDLPESNGEDLNKTPQQEVQEAPSEGIEKTNPEIHSEIEENSEPTIDVNRVPMFNEVQTPENTPAKNPVPLESAIKFVSSKEEEEELKKSGFFSHFLIGNRKIYEETLNTLNEWEAFLDSEVQYREGNISKEEYQEIARKWNQFKEKRYPELSQEELDTHLRDIYVFMDNILDGHKLRSKLMKESDLSTHINRGLYAGKDLITSSIIPKKPNNNSAVDLNERMRRQALGASDEPYTYDILLKNSFVTITIKRPNNMMLSGLIQSINKGMKGYVRKLNYPTPHLAYMGAIREFWEYFHKLIVDCSIKDIGSFKDLSDFILITDLDAIMTGFMEAIKHKGHPVVLKCLQEGCGWSDSGIIDPSKLLLTRNKKVSAEDSAIYANLLNKQVKYSMSEVREIVNNSIETEKVYNQKGNYYLEVRPPYISTGFESLDYIEEIVNPQIRDIRANSISPEDFQTRLNNFLLNISPIDYLHWVNKTVTISDVGGDEPDSTINRFSEDSVEFNKGVMSVITDNNELGKSLISTVLNKSPFMSKTFAGIKHYECPKCLSNSELKDELELGYTPINTFMNFFTLTQLHLITETAENFQQLNETP